MSDYKKMYLHLFNRVTDALDDLHNGNMNAAEEKLVLGQQECEEIYIHTADCPETEA